MRSIPKNYESELEKQRIEYERNPQYRHQMSRERAQNKKSDSDTNIAKFERETEFGPKFVCSCSHEGHF